MPRLSLFGRCREHGIRCIENIKFLSTSTCPSGNSHLPSAKTLQNFPNPAAKGLLQIMHGYLQCAYDLCIV